MSEWVGLFNPHNNPLGRYQYCLYFSQGEKGLNKITQLEHSRAWTGPGSLQPGFASLLPYHSLAT